jgi:hypothetical protein
MHMHMHSHVHEGHALTMHMRMLESGGPTRIGYVFSINTELSPPHS